MPNDGSNLPGSEGDARKLIVAMALLTREFERGRAAALFANRERGQAAPPDWAMMAASALAAGGRGPSVPAAPGPSQERDQSKPQEVVIVGQRATVAVHDVGATRFGREERREQDKQFRAAIFGGPTKIPGADQKQRESKAAAGAGAADAVAKSLVGKFALVFGPLAALSTVLSQTNSGFGVFQKSIQVFAASLAPILLPVFALLAAAVLTVSDKIFQELLPKLDDWYKWVLDKGIPAMEAFAKSIGRATGALVRWAERLGISDKEKKPGEEEKSPEEKRMQIYEDLDPFGLFKGIPKFMDRIFGERYEEGHEVGEANPDIKKYGGARPEDFGIGKPEPFVPPILRGIIGPKSETSSNPVIGGFSDIGGEIINRLGRAKSETGTSSKPGTGALPGDFRGYLDLVMKSLQQSMLPKPSYQALTEVGRSANLAAVGQDPIDTKLMQRMIISFEKLLETIARNTEKKQEPTFKGDF